MCICQGLQAGQLLKSSSLNAQKRVLGGTREQAEPPAAAVDLTRACTPIPDSTADEAEQPDQAEGDGLARRLTEKGWEGAVIKSELLICHWDPPGQS